MDSVCQSTNLTIMNDSCAAGTAPCITSPHGKMNDRGMPGKGERPWLGTGDGTSPTSADRQRQAMP